jgi:hypothetical protein
MDGVRLRPRVALAAGLMLTAACTSLSNLSGGGDGGTSDAQDGAPDSIAPPPAPPGTSDGSPSPDAGPDGPLNLLPNPGFEQGGGGCGPGWGSYGAVVTRSTDARTGGSACQLCANTTGSMELKTATPVAAKAGAYSAEAWIRAPGTGPAAGATGVQWQYHAPDGGSSPIDQGSMITPSATWMPSNGSFSLGSDGTLDFMVHVYYPDGGCVLFDDLGLYPAN